MRLNHILDRTKLHKRFLNALSLRMHLLNTYSFGQKLYFIFPYIDVLIRSGTVFLEICPRESFISFSSSSCSSSSSTSSSSSSSGSSSSSQDRLLGQFPARSWPEPFHATFIHNIQRKGEDRIGLGRSWGTTISVTTTTNYHHYPPTLTEQEVWGRREENLLNSFKISFSSQPVIYM